MLFPLITVWNLQCSPGWRLLPPGPVLVCGTFILEITLLQHNGSGDRLGSSASQHLPRMSTMLTAPSFCAQHLDNAWREASMDKCLFVSRGYRSVSYSGLPMGRPISFVYLCTGDLPQDPAHHQCSSFDE